MPTYKKINFGDGLTVVDEGGGVITVNAGGGGGGGTGAGPGNTFIFTQTTPATTWTVTHSLNAFPSVTVVDSGGSEIIPTLVYTDSNTVTLTFGSATSGKAFLN